MGSAHDGTVLVGELELEVAREGERADEVAEEGRCRVEVFAHGHEGGRGCCAVDDGGFETGVGGVEQGCLGGDGCEEVGGVGGGVGGVGEEWEGGGRGEGVDVGVDFLEVEEDAGEGGGEVERGVGGVVGAGYEGGGEGVGGEGGGEEGLVVYVGDFCGGHGGDNWVRGEGRGASVLEVRWE